MIKSFYKYICYIVYKRALKSSKRITGIENRTSAYLNFLLLCSILPLIILFIRFDILVGIINFVTFYLPNIKNKAFVTLIILAFFWAFLMWFIYLIIKRSYLENLTMTEKEIKKNKPLLWLIILAFLLYLIIKIIIVRGWYSKFP